MVIWQSFPSTNVPLAAFPHNFRAFFQHQSHILPYYNKYLMHECLDRYELVLLVVLCISFTVSGHFNSIQDLNVDFHFVYNLWLHYLNFQKIQCDSVAIHIMQNTALCIVAQQNGLIYCDCVRVLVLRSFSALSKPY